MKTQETTTTNLADFCYRERELLIELLQAWHSQGLPEDFHFEEVTPMFNRNSGHVFLTNAEYQACMMNGSKLETWYNCPNCSHEGFAEDCKLNEQGCNECNPENECTPITDEEI